MVTEQLEIADSAAELGRLSDWLEALSQRHGLSEQTRFRMELLLEEAATNVISYAYREQGPHRLQVSVEIGTHQVKLKLEDDGIAFNPLEQGPVQLPESLAEARVGGMGIHLIRSYTRRSSYSRTDDRNQLLMVIDR
jgi:anti-sigma regulatory factor (Ser/Thr protein kinase)